MHMCGINNQPTNRNNIGSQHGLVLCSGLGSM